MSREMTRKDFYAARHKYRAMMSSLIWYRSELVKHRSKCIIETMASSVHSLIHDQFDDWIVESCYGRPDQRSPVSIMKLRKEGYSNQYLRISMMINSGGGFS
ncbi:hypothetical protein MED16_gp40 [Pantoea phage vB_PagS_MED16]|nr:hypothetical protein MED16_gp40 [Pantoea phage vB_PagS_MED16]